MTVVYVGDCPLDTPKRIVLSMRKDGNSTYDWYLLEVNLGYVGTSTLGVQYGAETRTGGNYAELYRLAKLQAEKSGLVISHVFDTPEDLILCWRMPGTFVPSANEVVMRKYAAYIKGQEAAHQLIMDFSRFIEWSEDLGFCTKCGDVDHFDMLTPHEEIGPGEFYCDGCEGEFLLSTWRIRTLEDDNGKVFYWILHPGSWGTVTQVRFAEYEQAEKILTEHGCKELEAYRHSGSLTVWK